MLNKCQKRKASELYHLKPMNVFSGAVESLSSYLSRLSEAHCLPVDTLVSEILWPEMNLPGNTCTKVAFYESASKSINGVGIYAREFSLALQKFTLRSELRYLTMLPLANRIDVGGKGLLKDKKEWCPQCYEEQIRNVGFMYEPLRWSMSYAHRCDKHKTMLSSVCHVCKREQWALVRYTPLGYCIHCGANLSEGRCGTMLGSSDSVGLEWMDWFDRNLDLLFSNFDKLDECSGTEFKNVVTRIVDDCSNGNASHLDKMMGFGVGTITQWRRGRCNPRFDYLLRLAFRLDIDLIGLLQYEGKSSHIFNINSDSATPLDKRQSDKRYIHDHNAIENELDRVIREDSTKSVKYLVEKLGVSYGYLNYRFKEKIQLISNNYKKYVQEEKERKLNEKADSIRRTIRSLHKAGVYPSRNKVFTQAKGTSKTYEANHPLRDAWRNEMINLGYISK